jgi:hypothetical protein
MEYTIRVVLCSTNGIKKEKFMQVYVGIDCGNEGAIVVINRDAEILEWHPMPLFSNSRLLPHISSVSILALVKILSGVKSRYPTGSFTVELPFYIPSLNKSTNIFKQGTNVQTVIDALHLVNVGFNLVSEKGWQPKGIKKGVKQSAKERNLELLPEKIKLAIIGEGKRTPHKGAVDAYLIASSAITPTTNHKSFLGYLNGEFEVVKKVVRNSKLR